MPVNKKLLIFGLLGLLLLGGGGAGALFALGIVGGDDTVAEVDTEPAPEANSEQVVTYIELKPITAPVTQGNRVLFNVMLTLSIEVSEQNEKERIARFMPRLRDAMLRELHQRPLRRQAKGSRFDIDEVKGRMLKIVKKTTRNDAVSDVLVIAAVRIN